MRQARRKAEELELSKLGGPNAKKQKTEDRNSKSKSSSPQRMKGQSAQIE